MKKAKNMAKKILLRYGHVIVSCAFVFVTLSANSSCICPFYEPEEPVGIEKFKRI